ncbi:MAG: succinate dehydrogenase assembly factor 2 [Arenicellales bacterium]|nr:succinate dehydrogenase assembly factor 2 [Arenicellales bacterium]MDP6790364.1 succinate dehydrogenase assembly factor 2 [Arenicellales bacterium]MDP6918162.1 succinate dehydrogenase assembly factor 2 [Arenicellales bacterium]
MSITGQRRINRLTWRSRRGVRELDGLLMPYAAARADRLNLGELAAFEELLAQPDPLLSDWFLQRSVPERPQLAALVSDILQFNRSSPAA